MESKDLVVIFEGEPMYAISEELLDNQDAWENLEELKETHWLKLLFYQMIEETNDLAELKELGLDLEQIEYHLQRLWNFSEDYRFHRSWEYPKCYCPKMDNMDMYPYQRVTTQCCPLHGK